MGKRIDLHTILENITSNVYFQPPESIKIQYPCIIYSRDNIDIKYADDNPYNNKIRYQIILIDSNPDSDILCQLLSLPTSSFERHYTKNNLNHDIIKLYY